MKIPRPAVPEPLAWAIAWVIGTVMFWSLAQVFDDPKSWYTCALLAGIVVAAGELLDRYKQKR
ncbi:MULTISPECIES: hypothetical protein [unclassified Streptomyces]|uniref:hypothetical protein n=1 Tax=unclassified Streptomyces TaxID=2593676 RepID=UPI002E2DE112|nr:hypothetical protein [Streptomyces sp. NBC_01453]